MFRKSAFGSTSAGRSAFGGTGSAFGPNSGYRSPASNFGSTNTSTFGANPGTSTGLFGATTQASSGGLFGATQVGYSVTSFWIDFNFFPYVKKLDPVLKECC